MINYTERLTLLMQDIVTRVEALSFIDMARRARVRAAGPHARRRRVRHLPLPHAAAERARLLLLARSRNRPHHAPLGVVRHQVAERVDRRAADQVHDFVRAAALLRSDARPVAQGALLSGRRQAWMAKLDTVVHELFHIDPNYSGIRRLDRGDGTYSTHCHSPRFFEQVAEMVSEYLDTRPDPSAYDFLRARLRDARDALRRRGRHDASDRFRRTRSASSSR